MCDRLLARAWWTAIMVLVAVTAIGTLLTSYRGVFELCAGNLTPGVARVLAALPLGAAAYLLCRHRGDLVGD